jgi:hypothetical protein
MRLRTAILLLVISMALASCGRKDAYTLAPISQLPDFLEGQSTYIREAYRFAITNEDVLENYPCYCGCVKMNHTSNAQCYVKEVRFGGEIVFDEHAVNCGVCVDTTHDVMRMMNEGRSTLEIREYIDATYGSVGPGTNTGMPDMEM